VTIEGKMIAAAVGTNADVPVKKQMGATAEPAPGIKRPSVRVGETVDEKLFDPTARPVDDSEAAGMGGSTVERSRARNLRTTIGAMDMRDNEPSRPPHIRAGATSFVAVSTTMNIPAGLLPDTNNRASASGAYTHR